MRATPYILVIATALAGPASAVSLASSDAATVVSWGEFGADGQGKVELARVVSKGGVRPESFWIVETPSPFWVAERSIKTDGKTVSQWADSRSCDGFGVLLGKLSALRAAPTVGAPGPYRIDLKGASADPGLQMVQVSGAAGSAAALWVDGALKTLSPCWSATAPSFDP